MFTHFNALIESTRCVAIEGRHQDGTPDFLSCSIEGNDMHRIEPHPTRREAIDRAVALAVELRGEPPIPSVRDLRCQTNSPTKSTT